MKTIRQTFYDKGLSDNYEKADEVLKEYLPIERRRPILEELNDDNGIDFIHKHKFKNKPN